ncbi:MAG: dihydroorotate dehydrogenase [Planctomycetia bacterium]|nr:dihydroorotate dehydrogenase [Planctomycetia bacterium]
MCSLAVSLGRLHLENPVLVASGTFGYAKDVSELFNSSGKFCLGTLGGIIPKTITRLPRDGNLPPRTCETSAGLLNAIGLDNDGLEEFIAEKMPYLCSIGAPIIVSIAGRTAEEYAEMAEVLAEVPGVAALELNISCPNVAHGTDFGKNALACENLVSGVRRAAKEVPIITKLTPNVGDITEIARAAEAGGTDAVSLINTVLGLAVNWRTRTPRLGNGMGGLSGPAVKPIALRMVYQVSRAVKIPIIGVGGIETVEDCMEFFVAGASAIQVGTANFYRPTAAMEILNALPHALTEAGVSAFTELVGTLRMP